ncbi:hypothetical protein EVAR_7625_1 [Eumeta japonica]|uniref:Uncharacterized protein n=1 Tax=Eumeta variegata TaxID=151549 RepID=A0A4C1TJD1_EUMVA|nr:hypothetical protein EVAR_7625_1 [Eumeta japonica]
MGNKDGKSSYSGLKKRRAKYRRHEGNRVLQLKREGYRHAPQMAGSRYVPNTSPRTTVVSCRAVPSVDTSQESPP